MYKFIYIVLKISLPWDRIWTLSVQLVSVFNWRHIDCIQSDWITIIIIDAGVCSGGGGGADIQFCYPVTVLHF